MSLTAFSDTSLVREKTNRLLLNTCDVLISKGDLTDETLPTVATWPTFIAKFENIGVNAVDSPTWNFESVTEDFDYEQDVAQFDITGEVMVKKVNGDFLSWLSDDLLNQTVTVLIAPKSACTDESPAVGDTMLFIEGVKLLPKGEGKSNSGDTSTFTFAFSVKRKKPTDVYTVHTLAAS
jgi:hypothetical protein